MNIVLIGMMGSGKTTVGELLANNLQYKFIDTDSIIVKNENCSINEIFEKKGESYFRELERKVLKDVLISDKQVISTGGGIVKNPKNMKLIKEKATVIYLKASHKVLYKRTKSNKERPLLNTEDMENKLKSILEDRISLYEQAHYTINAEKTPKEIIRNIIEKLS